MADGDVVVEEEEAEEDEEVVGVLVASVPLSGVLDASSKSSLSTIGA
jgi:hypothetical protein